LVKVFNLFGQKGDFEEKESVLSWVTIWIFFFIEESFNFGKYTVPKGVHVVFSAFVLHYDPQQYQNPDQFNPERFLPTSEENKNRNKFAHIPFGLGQRMCLGKNFAVEQLKIILIRTYQKFTFKVDPSTKLPLKAYFAQSISPANPVYLKIVKRET